MITLTITIADHPNGYEFAAELLGEINHTIDATDYVGIDVTVASRWVDGGPIDFDDDVHYLCDVCGRIGTADDGISADGDPCPDDACDGTVRIYRGDAS